MLKNRINLFVPGRVSIIGELSDWVTDYICQDNTIIPGEVIAGGINKGIYAVAEVSYDFKFEFGEKSILVKNMNLDELSNLAKGNEFFSYVASVAYFMKSKFDVGGVYIKVRYMNLPIQKGLSSSASVCVLTAKAFNNLYNLNLKFDEIMELAYEAERYALSMCGRLDQICAKGLGVSHIVFNEDKLDINELDIGKELNFVIADLNGFKDTKKILSSLHKCFPFPKNDLEMSVRKTLCEDNKYLVGEAIKAIRDGNIEYLGSILTKWQENLDNSGGKVTDALEGPLLHKTMADPKIKELSYGAKGTGSNGDGSIIILAKDRKCQSEVLDYLDKHYGMSAFEFNVNGTHKVKSTVVLLDDSVSKEKYVQLAKTLDLLGMERIYFVGDFDKNAYVDSFNLNLSDAEFDKLSVSEKEDYIKLVVVFDKIKFIDGEELINGDYLVDESLFILGNENNLNNDMKYFSRILDNYDDNGNLCVVNNIDEMVQLVETTVIKYKN